MLVFAFGGNDLIHVVHDIFLGVGLGLLCTVMKCGDIIYRSTSPQIRWLDTHDPRAVLILDALSYFWATLDVAPWLFDLFVVAFIERLFRSAYKKLWVCRIFCFGEEGVDNAKYSIPKWKTENANYKHSRETRKKNVYTC